MGRVQCPITGGRKATADKMTWRCPYDPESQQKEVECGIEGEISAFHCSRPASENYNEKALQLQTTTRRTLHSSPFDITSGGPIGTGTICPKKASMDGSTRRKTKKTHTHHYATCSIAIVDKAVNVLFFLQVDSPLLGRELATLGRSLRSGLLHQRACRKWRVVGSYCYSYVFFL